MNTFICLSCRTEKDVRHKAPDRPDKRPQCKTCRSRTQPYQTRTDGYHKRTQKRYRNGAMPPWALSFHRPILPPDVS